MEIEALGLEGHIAATAQAEGIWADRRPLAGRADWPVRSPLLAINPLRFWSMGSLPIMTVNGQMSENTRLQEFSHDPELTGRLPRAPTTLISGS